MAVSLILGWILSLLGPGASAINNSMPPIPKSGKIAMVKTIIPIPPIHWVILLQKRMLFGKDSISSNMVEPVVVKPDIVSKKALVKTGILPDIKYGRQPKRVINSQPPTTIRYPSRFLISELLCFFVSNLIRKPEKMVIPPHNKKSLCNS